MTAQQVLPARAAGRLDGVDRVGIDLAVVERDVGRLDGWHDALETDARIPAILDAQRMSREAAEDACAREKHALP